MGPDLLREREDDVLTVLLAAAVIASAMLASQPALIARVLGLRPLPLHRRLRAHICHLVRG